MSLITEKEYKRAADNLESNPDLAFLNEHGGILEEEILLSAVLVELARTNVILRRIESTLDQIEIHTRRIK